MPDVDSDMPDTEDKGGGNKPYQPSVNTQQQAGKADAEESDVSH